MGFYVAFARTMAAFTAGVFRFFFFTCDAFKVRVLVEAGPNVRMAGFANRAADEFAGRSLGEGGRRQDCEEQGYFRSAMHASRLGRCAGECR